MYAQFVTTLLLVLSTAVRAAPTVLARRRVTSGRAGFLARRGARIGFIVGMIILGLILASLLFWCIVACCIGGAAARRRRTGALPSLPAGPAMATGAQYPTHTTAGAQYAPPAGPPPDAGAPSYPEPTHHHGV